MHAQLTYSYQVNYPPPLGSPRCQFPDLTLPGLCGNIVLYKPLPANAVRTPPSLLSSNPGSAADCARAHMPFNPGNKTCGACIKHKW